MVVKSSGAFSPLGVALDSVHRVVYVSTHEGQLWRFSLRVLEEPRADRDQDGGVGARSSGGGSRVAS
ncbi:hypothetical protein SFUMM280S_04784 [Streptomyces fumanus]